jgi:hypothetical protein
LFTVVAQVESWWKIQNKDPNTAIDLSEQIVLSCGNAGTCSSGMTPEPIFDFVQKTGLPPEACLPYQAKDNLLCSNACPNWQQQAVKIPGWGYITSDEAIIENIKNAVYRQPIYSYMLVYQDLLSYSGGVYEHVSGNTAIGHAVLIIGWDDLEQCWICKNEWGEAWGESGYFRIKWGDCYIGTSTMYIWNSTIKEDILLIKPQELNLSLTYGDSLSENFSLLNQGAETIDYSAFEYETNKLTEFHSDSFNAFDGKSFWCGDPEIHGYDNQWLQYLDLPSIKLSNTSNPKLFFMVYWAVESPLNPLPGFDGWDGCNVWISNNNGKTFHVADPITPEYNCHHLYSFKMWYLGNQISGWGGSSNSWKSAELDLSLFKTDSVVIRFAFTADPGYCTANDAQLTGFFVDDIQVADGGNILFENHGDSLSNMRPSGYSTIQESEWISLSNGMNSILPNDSTTVGVQVNTKNLKPGQYGGIINFSYNDSAGIIRQRVVNIEVNKPIHEIGIEDVWPLGQNIPVLINENRVMIHNYGLQDEYNFDVVYHITDNKQISYEDTVHVASLQIDESKAIQFKPQLGIEPGNFDRNITIIHLVDDHNAFNNTLNSHVTLSNLWDDFEVESDLWDYQGGWGTTYMAQHSGSYSAHVNQGQNYLPNSNAMMTLNRALDLQSLKSLSLKYWVRYQTQKNKDKMFFEASADSLNWVKMDSLSGVSDWAQKQVDLSGFINTPTSKVWMRFHFVSDDKTQLLGVFIDDVELFPESLSEIVEGNSQIKNPLTWHLAQNYPNPFNPVTTIRISVPYSSQVLLKVFDLLGREVATLKDEVLKSGAYSVLFDASGLTSGVYIVQMSSEGFKDIKKVVVLK